MEKRLACVLVSALLGACGGLDEFEEVIVEEATIRMTDGTAGAPFAPMYGAGFSNIDLSQAKTFNNEGLSPGDVDAIYVKSVQLEVSTGANSPVVDRLDLYVERMEMTVEADGQAKTAFATLDPVPMATVADLDVPMDFDMKPYAVAPSMTVGASVMLKEPRGVVVTLKTTITLLIDVNILGQ